MCEDDYDYEMKPSTRITFLFTERDKNGREITNLARTLHGDDCVYLPTILEAFVYFLQGMTFNYVEGVTAVKDGKDTCSSFEA